MPARAHSVPPAAESQVQLRPARLRAEDVLTRERAARLAKAPRRTAAREQLAGSLDAFMRAEDISNLELAELAEVTPKIVARWRSGRSPIPAEVFDLLAERRRNRWYVARLQSH